MQEAEFFFDNFYFSEVKITFSESITHFSVLFQHIFTEFRPNH